MKNPEDSTVFEVVSDLPDVFNVNNASLQTMKALTRNFSRLTYLTREYLTPAASILFSKDFSVVEKHDELSHLYTHEDFEIEYTYQDFCISLPVYQKINSIWFRLPSIKNRYYLEEKKTIPVLDVTTNKVFFYEDKSGFSDEEFDHIISNSQKQKFFERLKLKIGNSLEKASTAEGGVRYTKKVFEKSKYTRKIEELLLTIDHTPTLVSNKLTKEKMNFYTEKIGQHTGSKYKPKYYDPKYEEIYMKSILDFDSNNTENLTPNTFNLPTDAPDSLAKCDIKDIDMGKITEELMQKLEDENSFESSIPLKMSKMKSSFILPFATVASKDRAQLTYKNEKLISSLCTNKIG